MKQSLKRTVFGGLALAAAVAAGTACAGGRQPAPAGAARAGQPPVATTAAAGPTTAAAPSPSPAPDTPASTPTRPAYVEVALIDRMDRNSVSWTDGKVVPAKLDNQIPEALPGPQHKHTAMLAGDAVFYTPTGCAAERGDIHLDADALGTVPCTKEGFIRVKDWTTKIFFNAGGQVVKIASRYQP